jgi:hypothetical protein
MQKDYNDCSKFISVYIEIYKNMVFYGTTREKYHIIIVMNETTTNKRHHKNNLNLNVKTSDKKTN